MADPLEPNDLSHLTDYEFHTLCPLGEHAPGPEPLSPAAQAVLSAAEDAYGFNYSEFYCCADRVAAAALRAAAHHLKTIAPWVGHLESPGLDWGVMELESIAAELEGAQ